MVTLITIIANAYPGLSLLAVFLLSIALLNLAGTCILAFISAVAGATEIKEDEENK